MKSRRSLLDNPATTTPQTPIARARVSVSASTREPTTRIVPAEPTSSPPERSSPSAPAWRRPRVGPPRATTPRMPRPAARIVMPVPGRTERTIPANGDSTASAMSPVATRQRPCQSKTYSPPGPCSSPRRGRPTHRPPGSRHGRRRDLHLVEPGVAQSLGDRGTEHDRIAGRRRAAGRPERARRRRRPVTAISRRAETSRTSAALTPPSRSRSRSATTRAARREGPTRSGSLSGTSRRSTTSPPSPPVTSMAKWRPRAPSRTDVAERELRDGRGPGRQVDQGEPARASGRAWSTRRSRGRPASRHSDPRAGRPG